MRLRRVALELSLTFLALLTLPRVSSAGDSWCDRCDLMIGAGATFRTWAWTDGLVVSLTLELDQSRWALSAYRFATAQQAPANAPPGTAHAADPYWGFTAMRRWQVLHRGSGRFYLGFGANYRSELDYLESTHWNFAYLVAARVDLDAHGRALELGLHHWSDAWIKPPNRGQNFLMLSLVF